MGGREWIEGGRGREGGREVEGWRHRGSGSVRERMCEREVCKVRVHDGGMRVWRRVRVWMCGGYMWRCKVRVWRCEDVEV